ncbi:MAG TPA: TspO/MBR family protein [Candidatus Saccharimonadales bacterium]|nr:TspO/MBR family protein [Candidatus Saccharimonadales bacterium]
MHAEFFGLTIQAWYTSIVLPAWAPPVWMFGLAWGIIYPLMTVSFAYVFYKSLIKHEWRRYVGALFALNLVFNLIYSVGTFAAFNDNQTLNDVRALYWPAAIVISVVLLTLPAMIIATWDRSKWVALAQLPYLAWVSVATLLQFSINFAN